MFNYAKCGCDIHIPLFKVCGFQINSGEETSIIVDADVSDDIPDSEPNSQTDENCSNSVISQTSTRQDENDVEHSTEKHEMNGKQRQPKKTFSAPKKIKLAAKQKHEDPLTVEAYSIMKKVYENKHERDEYDIYADNVASRIRHLRTHYAKVTTKHLIDNLLYEAELGHYDVPQNNESARTSLPHTSNVLDGTMNVSFDDAGLTYAQL